MTELLESPLLIAAIGGVVIVTFSYMWFQQGGKKLLFAALAAAGVTGLLLVVEQVVETPREEVKRNLQSMASDVERNDLPALLQHVSSSAPEIRSQVSAEFPRHKFHELRITKFEEITFGANGDTATVRLVVVADADFFNGQLPNQRTPRAAKLSLRKEQGQWKVAAYEHSSPLPHE